jgi:hypothetical protein
MLSNITLKPATANGGYENLEFTFFGNSMGAINRHALFGGETIHANKIDISELLMDGSSFEELKHYPVLVVCPYNLKEAVLAIKTIDYTNQQFVFEYLNIDKQCFPDVVLHLSDIRAIHAVVRIDTDLTTNLPCHCASDGDYCGDGCINERKEVTNA